MNTEIRTCPNCNTDITHAAGERAPACPACGLAIRPASESPPVMAPMRTTGPGAGLSWFFWVALLAPVAVVLLGVSLAQKKMQDAAVATMCAGVLCGLFSMFYCGYRIAARSGQRGGGGLILKTLGFAIGLLFLYGCILAGGCALVVFSNGFR